MGSYRVKYLLLQVYVIMKRTFQISYENTPFLWTSIINAYPNRLNWRSEILLTRNQEAIRGKRILDLGSHDGRLSYACLKLGASHVTGVELNSSWVNSARKNLIYSGYESEHFNFIEGDVFDFLPNAKPKEYDTILCCGFISNTARQIELLSEIKRIHPYNFILDTQITTAVFIRPPRRTYLELLVRLGQLIPTSICEKLAPKRSKAIKQVQRKRLLPDGNVPCLVFKQFEDHRFAATPTKTFIELALQSYDFSHRQLRWNKNEIEDWTHLKDYKAGHRVSYIAQPL